MSVTTTSSTSLSCRLMTQEKHIEVWIASYVHTRGRVRSLARSVASALTALARLEMPMSAKARACVQTETNGVLAWLATSDELEAFGGLERVKQVRQATTEALEAASAFRLRPKAVIVSLSFQMTTTAADATEAAVNDRISAIVRWIEAKARRLASATTPGSECIPIDFRVRRAEAATPELCETIRTCRAEMCAAASSTTASSTTASSTTFALPRVTQAAHLDWLVRESKASKTEAEVEASWTVLLDDDDLLSPDYGDVLRRVLARSFVFVEFARFDALNPRYVHSNALRGRLGPRIWCTEVARDLGLINESSHLDFRLSTGAPDAMAFFFGKTSAARSIVAAKTTSWKTLLPSSSSSDSESESEFEFESDAELVSNLISNAEEDCDLDHWRRRRERRFRHEMRQRAKAAEAAEAAEATKTAVGTAAAPFDGLVQSLLAPTDWALANFVMNSNAPQFQCPFGRRKHVSKTSSSSFEAASLSFEDPFDVFMDTDTVDADEAAGVDEDPEDFMNVDADGFKGPRTWMPWTVMRCQVVSFSLIADMIHARRHFSADKEEEEEEEHGDRYEGGSRITFAEAEAVAQDLYEVGELALKRAERLVGLRLGLERTPRCSPPQQRRALWKVAFQVVRKMDERLRRVHSLEWTDLRAHSNAFNRLGALFGKSFLNARGGLEADDQQLVNVTSDYSGTCVALPLLQSIFACLSDETERARHVCAYRATNLPNEYAKMLDVGTLDLTLRCCWSDWGWVHVPRKTRDELTCHYGQWDTTRSSELRAWMCPNRGHLIESAAMAAADAASTTTHAGTTKKTATKPMNEFAFELEQELKSLVMIAETTVEEVASARAKRKRAVRMAKMAQSEATTTTTALTKETAAAVKAEIKKDKDKKVRAILEEYRNAYKTSCAAFWEVLFGTKLAFETDSETALVTASVTASSLSLPLESVLAELKARRESDTKFHPLGSHSMRALKMVCDSDMEYSAENEKRKADELEAVLKDSTTRANLMFLRRFVQLQQTTFRLWMECAGSFVALDDVGDGDDEDTRGLVSRSFYQWCAEQIFDRDACTR